MGACYSVVCRLKFNIWSEDKVLEKLRECYGKHLREHVGFCIEEYPFKTPRTIQDFMELYFTKHQKMFSFAKERLKNDNMIYEAASGFDASYGWWRIMYDFFESIGTFLMRGSRLEIWEDNDYAVYRIKDGKVN